MALLQFSLKVWMVTTSEPSREGGREHDVSSHAASSRQPGRTRGPAPPHAALAFRWCRASEAQAATALAVTSSTAPWVRKTVTAHLICQPIYGNIESCQKRQRKHLL